MNYTSNKGFPAGNPIANALVIVVGILTVAASIVLGFFAFLILLSLVMVIAAVVGVRTWWFGRNLRHARPPADQAAAQRARQSGSASNVIEGEFRVVEGRKHGDRH